MDIISIVVVFYWFLIFFDCVFNEEFIFNIYKYWFWKLISYGKYWGIEFCLLNINFKEDYMKMIIKINKINDVFYGLEMVVLKIK